MNATLISEYFARKITEREIGFDEIVETLKNARIYYCSDNNESIRIYKHKNLLVACSVKSNAVISARRLTDA